MTVTEQRRWIKEYRALRHALDTYWNPELEGWELQIVPARAGEFSLLCINPEHRAPLVYIAIATDSAVTLDMLEDWAKFKVTSSLAYAAIYIKKEIWRQMPLPEA